MDEKIKWISALVFSLVLLLVSSESHAQNWPAWLRDVCKVNKSNCYYTRGKLVEQGDGVRQSTKEAIDWYRRSAKRDDNLSSYNAQFALGRLLISSGTDLSEGVMWLERADSRGFSIATFQLALFYKTGLTSFPETILKKDLDKYRQLITKAAKAGNPQAQHELGIAYRDGVGVNKNLRQSFRWFKSSFEESKSYESQLALAQAYESGSGTRKNLGKAFALYNELASSNSPLASFAYVPLGKMYSEGSGVRKNERRAAGYFEMAAQKGIAEGEYHLGLYYLTGKGGKQRSERRAKQLMISSAEGGYSSAQSWYAHWLYKEAETEVEFKKVLDWAKKASSQKETDEPDALLLASKIRYWELMNRISAGGPRPLELLYRDFESAASAGLPEAYFYLGLMNQSKSRGVGRKPATAAEYFAMGSDAGYFEASVMLGELYLKEGDESSANYYFERAESQGFIEPGAVDFAKAFIGSKRPPETEMLEITKSKSKNNLVTAQVLLSGLYLEGGLGLRKDSSMGLTWLMIADEVSESYRKNYRDPLIFKHLGGNLEVKRELKRAERNFSPVELEKARTRAKACIRSGYEGCMR